MNSTVMAKSTEADEVLAARADERLAHAYEQIASADEQLARLTEQLTRMEQEEAARRPAAILVRRPSHGRAALRGFMGLLAAACIIGGAFVAQSSYGEAIRPAIARWAAPYVGSVSRLALAAPEASAQPGPSGVRLAAADAAVPQAAPSVGTAPQDGASPAAAVASPDLAQLLQAMARDLSTVQQGIEELKAGQQRMAGENARVAEQLRASQEQVARLVAKASEQEQRARLPAPPPRPTAEPARKPAQTSQARTQPIQLAPPTR